uniref:Uncharacterized protein n=1 Tax=Anopheles farauti TaxID=69004 RepID=A0A182QYR5_9DIPT
MPSSRSIVLAFLQTERAQEQTEPVGHDGVEHQHGRKHEISLQLARLRRHRVDNRGVYNRKEDLPKLTGEIGAPYPVAVQLDVGALHQDQQFGKLGRFALLLVHLCRQLLLHRHGQRFHFLPVALVDGIVVIAVVGRWTNECRRYRHYRR